jgi:nucleoside-diphosphate-sugar epimerase
MHVTITGAAGLLGYKLAEALLSRGHLAGNNLTKLTLFDRVAPSSLPNDPRLETISGNITNPQAIRDITREPDVFFHLAAVLSGEAEQNFALGMQVNLHATQQLLEACRQRETPLRFIFASTTAVYGGEMPPLIEDVTCLTPQSSYGTQKAISELLLNDYSRRGFIDGRAIRLPTIVVRPGQPNQATSTFASSIIREPLQGQPAVCPVTPETRLWIMSPRRAIASFLRVAELPAAAFGSSRVTALPGLSVSVQEMVAALRHIAGPAVAERIRWEPDPFIQKIVGSWPDCFAPKKAERLGFAGDESMREIIEAFIEDELGGAIG